MCVGMHITNATGIENFSLIRKHPFPVWYHWFSSAQSLFAFSFLFPPSYFLFLKMLRYQQKLKVIQKSLSVFRMYPTRSPHPHLGRAVVLIILAVKSTVEWTKNDHSAATVYNLVYFPSFFILGYGFYRKVMLITWHILHKSSHAGFNSLLFAVLVLL